MILEQMGKHLEILTAKFYHIDDTITSSSEIRLMDDCDTEDVSLWIETTMEGGQYKTSRGRSDFKGKMNILYK